MSGACWELRHPANFKLGLPALSALRFLTVTASECYSKDPQDVISSLDDLLFQCPCDVCLNKFAHSFRTYFYSKSIRKANEGSLFRWRDFLSTLMMSRCLVCPFQIKGTEVTRIQPSKTFSTTSAASTLPKSDREAVLVALKIMSEKEKSFISGRKGLLVLKSPSFLKTQMWHLDTSYSKAEGSGSCTNGGVRELLSFVGQYQLDALIHCHGPVFRWEVIWVLLCTKLHQSGRVGGKNKIQWAVIGIL